jgi:hypothetical protein
VNEEKEKEKDATMVNFGKIILGARGVQALLSVVVLGLMAYGTSLPPRHSVHVHG